MEQPQRPRSSAGSFDPRACSHPSTSNGNCHTCGKYVGDGQSRESAPLSKEPAEPAEPGTGVDVVWGEERFQPLQFHGVVVGPFKATFFTRPGESVVDCLYRGWLELNTVAMRVRDEKFREYVRGIEEAAAMVDRKR